MKPKFSKVPANAVAETPLRQVSAVYYRYGERALSGSTPPRRRLIASAACGARRWLFF